MRFDDIIQRLRISLGADIAVQKSKYAKREQDLKDNEDYNTFMNIISKTSFTIEDINDLLVCNSDRFLSNEKILQLVLNKQFLMYDAEQFGYTFSVKTVVLYYLLSLKDSDIPYKALQCFSYEKLGFKRNESLERIADLKIGDTLYDLYLLVEEINKIEDIELKKRKVIALMGLVDGFYFLDDLKQLGINFTDVENFFRYVDSKNGYLSRKDFNPILSTLLKMNNRILGDEKLFKKVRGEYKKYAQKHLTFTAEEFISYYNETFNDDFSSFFYNISEKVLLNEELFYSFINSYGFNYTMINHLSAGEYAFEYSSFDSEACGRESEFKYHKDRYEKKYNHRLSVLKKYANVLERLKQPIDYTLSYFMALNVDKKDIDEFESIVDWYCDNQPDYFGRDVRNSTEVQNKNTFEAILAQSKKDMAANFKNRKKVHSGNYDEIVKHIGAKYIAKSSWNAYVKSFEIEYYVDKGLRSVKILLDCLARGEDVYKMAIELGVTSEVYLYFDAICVKMPELVEQITTLRNVYAEAESFAKATKELLDNENYIKYCEDIITKFIEKNYKTKEAFLAAEKITEGQFERILSVVEKNNFPLYSAFTNKFEALKSQRYAILMKSVDYILNAIVNGVEENGVTRPFTFLDYSLYTKIPFDKFVELLVNSKKLNNTNIRQFRQFEKAVRSYRMVTNEYIFAEKYILKVNGVMHEVTREEKEIALRYMRLKEFDNYYALYKMVLLRVLKGEITYDTLMELSSEKKVGKKFA